MRSAKFGFVRSQCDDRSWNGSDQCARRKHRERMKTIAEQSHREAVRNRKTPTQAGTESGHRLPLKIAGRILNFSPHNTVAARRVEVVTSPRQGSKPRKTRNPNQPASPIDSRFVHWFRTRVVSSFTWPVEIALPDP